MPYKEGKYWRGKVQYGGQRHTKRHNTKKEAADWERNKFKELKLLETQPEGTALMSLCVSYLQYAELKFSKKVFDEKKSVVKRLLKEFKAEQPIESIDVPDAQKYLTKQAKLRSNNAANKDRKNLHAMWEKGITFKWGPKSNPWAPTEEFPHDRSPQYTPPTEDVLKVLAAADRRDKDFLLAYVYTGARRSEIFRWTWVDDINFEQRSYRLGTRKTRDGNMQYEWFPMPDELYNALWWLYNNRVPDRYKLSDRSIEILKSSPYVFPNQNPHQTIGDKFTQRRWFMHDLCERAGVRFFGYHAIRRYFASRLKDMKKGTKSIQRMLRHQSITTTEKYIYALNDDLEGITDGLLENQKAHKEAHTPNKKGVTT